MELSVIPTLKRRGESFHFPASPKEMKCLKISKLKKDQIQSYKIQSFSDEDENEFVIISQKFNEENVHSIVLSPDKADLLIEDIKKYLQMYIRRRFKSKMQEVYLRMIQDKISNVRKDMCEGCLEDYPSQIHHYCFTAEAKHFVEDAFSKLIEIVDEAEANRICNKTLRFKEDLNFSKAELLADKKWTNELKSKIICFLGE